MMFFRYEKGVEEGCEGAMGTPSATFDERNGVDSLRCASMTGIQGV